MIRSCWSCIRKVIKKEDDWNSSVHKRMVNQDNKYYGGIAPFVVVILLFFSFSFFTSIFFFFTFSHVLLPLCAFISTTRDGRLELGEGL